MRPYALAFLHDWALRLHPAPLLPSASAGVNAGLISVLLLAAAGGLWGAQRGNALGLHHRLRWLLLLLIGVLLFAPQAQYVTVRQSSGTLYLLLDQSRSMASLDPQASPIERLRWADALGFLPPGIRTGRPDRLAAALSALRQQLADLQSASLVANPDDATRNRYVASLKAWQRALTERIAASKDDALVTGPGDSTLDDLRRLATAVDNAIDAAANQPTAHDVASDIPWPGFDNDLGQAAEALTTIADAADAKALESNTGNAALQAALARVSAMSRADLAAAVLQHGAADNGTSLSSLYAKYRTQIVTVADTAHADGSLDPAAADETLRLALAPGGNATNLTAGLSLIGESLVSDQPASIVLVSDGRQNTPSNPAEAARLLAARGVRVFGLTIGSLNVAPDAAVEEPDAPDWIFKGDTVSASARIRLDGLAGVPLHVDFLRDNAVIDTRPIIAHTAQSEQRIRFHDTPPGVRGYTYAIRVSAAPSESNKQNNIQTFHVTVKKDRLNVLLVDDSPRWEFRYLAAALRRDQRIKLQTVLLDPARVTGITLPPPVRASPDNPDVEAQLLPATAAAWNQFDLVILGDIPPAALPPLQQQLLLEAVRDRGATLIGIAGRWHFPAQFADSPLVAALPIEPGDWTPAALQRDNDRGFRPGIAPEGNASVLTQLGLDGDANAAAWTDMPLWYWHSVWTAAKPAASVYWSINPLGNDAAAASLLGDAALARRHALLSSLPLGAGRVLFLAADQSWRLRQVDGDELHTRFWAQVIRWAVGSDLPAGGRWVRFGAGRTSYVAGAPITITARVLREDLSPYTGLTIHAVAHSTDAAGPIISTTDLTPVPTTPGYYRGTFVGLPAGPASITLDGPEVNRLLDNDPTAAAKSMAIMIRAAADLEQRNTNTDPAEMRRIAAAGDGVALLGPYADLLAAQIPAIQKMIRTPQSAGLFADAHSPVTRWCHVLFLILFVGVITGEWLARKRSGLV